MAGPKNIGQQIESRSSNTCLQSEKASINFVIPRVSISARYKKNDMRIPKRLNTWCLEPILDKMKGGENDSFMICTDAKTVTTGLDKMAETLICSGKYERPIDIF